MLREQKTLLLLTLKLQSQMDQMSKDDELRLRRKPSTPSNQYLVPVNTIYSRLNVLFLWRSSMLSGFKTKSKLSTINLRFCVNKWPNPWPLAREERMKSFYSKCVCAPTRDTCGRALHVATAIECRGISSISVKGNEEFKAAKNLLIIEARMTLVLKTLSIRQSASALC